jgi:DNA mismatch repair protein MutL
MAGGVRLIAVEDDGAASRATSCPGAAPPRHQQDRQPGRPGIGGHHGLSRRGAGRHRLGGRAGPAVAHRRRRPAPPGWTPAAASCARRPRRGHHGGGAELFFSTPARRKFLKTDATELAHCLEAVRRHALARPDVGFAIWHEGKLVEQWRATTRAAEQRLADVLGETSGRNPRRGLQRRAAARDRAAPACPTAARAARRPAVPAYVNGRFVRDKVLDPRRAQRL